MVASVLACAYRSLTQDLKTRDMNGLAAWLSEIIAEISGNCHGFCSCPHLGLVCKICFSHAQLTLTLTRSPPIPMHNTDILSPEDYSKGRPLQYPHHTNLSSSPREQDSAVSDSIPVSDHTDDDHTALASRERMGGKQIGKGVAGPKQSRSSMEDMCGTWRGELERCCTSCISGRRVATQASGAGSGSLGLAMIPNYEKRAMTVIGLEYGGPAERSGRVAIGDELVVIDSQCVETLLSGADGEDVVHKLLTGITRMQEHTGTHEHARTRMHEHVL
jgi:hypothetical protein